MCGDPQASSVLIVLRVQPGRPTPLGAVSLPLWSFADRAAQLLFTGGFSALLGTSVPGFIIAGAVLVISLIMDKVLKKDTMGGGDIKLLFLCGCFLALPECLLMVMIACIIGIAMASILLKVDSETAFPFGPALSLAAVITLFIGDPVINWYLSLF